MSDISYLSTHFSIYESVLLSIHKNNEEMKEQLKKRDEIIQKLKTDLKIEKFKNKIYTMLIKENTTINLVDVIKEDNEGIHLHFKGDIPIYIKNDLKSDSEEKIHFVLEPTTEKKKTVFRKIKNKIDLAVEKPQENEEKIKKVQEDMEKLAEENKLNASIEAVSKIINENMKELEKCKIPKKYLNIIKDNRITLLAKFSIENYIKYTKTHVRQIENIFTKKKYETKKITHLIASSLSPLEQRLLAYEGYHNTVLLVDDIEKFKMALDLNTNHNKVFLSFSQQEINKELANYSMALFPCKENIKRVVYNPYGFHSLIYVSFPKSSLEDPYSFYILDNINNGQRRWRSDCRLLDFSSILSDFLKSYCITIFRKIYYDFFKDNIYRENYKSKANIFTLDCDQLLLNIIFLSKPKEVCNVFREIIVKNCTYVPTQQDSFNFTADDAIIKNTFNTMEDKSEDLVKVFQKIFENLSDEQAEKLISEQATLI